jgi:hypothetical protein
MPQKNKSYMTVEPLPKSTFTDKELASPKKKGSPSATIGPLDKAGEGWKAHPAIEHGEYSDPTKSKITRTSTIARSNPMKLGRA